MNVLNKIFGSSNSRKLKKMERVVTALNGFEEGFAALSDEGLRHKTGEFRKRLADNGESLDA